ncbi:hypothetical protein CK203_018368 [Vitis vinifera]|uniref:Retrovirus-related Pol polyprotein from transposon TNT 1-94 n=1 Tax=Vitis vinifera TaxID=29760 RepID=A0A438JPC2_VITVI|nr:hypothetical protein CK203_018368 [Vitis vinifera]
MNSASSISANVNNIPMLNGTNFKKWKEHVIIVLGCMDLDYALKEDRLLDLTSASTAEQRDLVPTGKERGTVKENKLHFLGHQNTGATTHISVTMQGCLRSRMPTNGERYIYVGNGNKVAVKAIAEVENQLSKKIKAVRSDHGGEYYGRYDGFGEQCPRPFAKYLMECGREVSSFMTPQLDPSLKRAMLSFIEDVELNGRESLRKVVFEEESVSIPIITIGLGHILFYDTIQNVQPITEIVDTLEILPTQVMEPIQVHEEVTQQIQEPQVQMPLRRSTRERRNTISDNYVVYLQEHEFDMGLEDDPISVSKVKQSSDSKKWIEAMEDEMKSMNDNGVWDLVELPVGVKLIGCK